MSNRRNPQHACGNNGYYNDVEVFSNNGYYSCGYKHDIQRDLTKIKRGIRQECEGLKYISNNNIHKGIREVSIGIRQVKEGLEDLIQGLKDIELRCNDLNKLKKVIKEVEEGLELASKGVKDITMGNLSQGIKEINAGICKENEGLEGIIRILTDMIYDYNNCCDYDDCYNYDYDHYYDYNYDYDGIRDIIFDIDINKNFRI